MGEFVPYPVEVPLRWSDMDAFGHVNNVQFLRLIEDARIRAIGEWFGSAEALEQWPAVVARSEIDYLAPLTFRPAPVRVGLRVSGFTEIGFDLGYEVTDPPEVGIAVYARAETMMVAYDVARSAPRLLSDTERSVYARYAAEPVALRSRTSLRMRTRRQ